MNLRTPLGPPDLSRRRLLQLAGTAVAGGAVASLAGCGGNRSGDDGTVVVGSNPDIAELLEEPIAQFTKDNPETTVEVRLLPADSSQYFDQIRTRLQAGSDDIDVFSGDVSWVAQLADNGWLADITDRFSEAERAEFLPFEVDARIWKDRVYGVPWYTDAGICYYRKDLLEASGYTEPPATWDELREMAARISQDHNVRYGFVFQGAQYEGGTVNGMEYIRSAGGDILSGDQVVIGSPEAVRGLSLQRSMVDSGVSPEAVAQFKEDESAGAFLAGDAVFLRNWPYVYDRLGDTSETELTEAHVGVTELPAADPGGQSVNVGGGWAFLVNAYSGRQEAAWRLAAYLTGADWQRFYALEGGFMPTRVALYDDQEILESQPAIAVASEAIQHTTLPPSSPYYSDMSLAMAKRFNESLRGAMPPDEAAGILAAELEEIVAAGQ